MQKSTSEIKSYKFNTLRVMDNPNQHSCDGTVLNIYCDL